MKKLILSAVVSGFLFTACQKEEVPSTAAPSPAKPAPTVQAISPVPATFVKKILAEEFVGATVGLTPEASLDLNTVMKNYPDMVYAASLHVYDRMTSNPTSTALKLLATQTLTYPIGMIDRKQFNGNLFIDSKQFDNAIMMLINKPVDCGLAISTTTASYTANIDVYTGFTATMPGTYKVTTYLIEDGIINPSPDFEQENSLNMTPGNYFFGAGNPLQNYEHRHVARRIIGASGGETINSANITAGGSQVFSYEIDIPAKLSGVSTFKVLSFISDATTNEVVNVQECVLGQEKDWN
jgi:hypothetical protein